MEGPLTRALIRLTARPKVEGAAPPLLVELFDWTPGEGDRLKEAYPFRFWVSGGPRPRRYGVSVLLSNNGVLRLRDVVQRISMDLNPRDVDPLTFQRLVGVLSQLAAERLAGYETGIAELSELAAYEAIGLARIMALAKDPEVTEFFVDSDGSPLYLDHSSAGRCDTGILLTERERTALETHLDTFRGYTLDYATPSLKNDLQIGDARLRVSLDTEPVAANRFSLDVRRLDLTSLSLPDLVARRAISAEAGAFLVCWLDAGGNVTIVGETGTGKTTLLNALDERLNPKLRRVYIEDAVETRDLLSQGYHQMKVKVDPFERGERNPRTKEAEIVKVLHRSPDIVILSEIQSEEHSRAFFHALAAGIRGIQTFHASSPEQAVRRWTTAHGVSRDSLVDLGVIVLMGRPDRLGPLRMATRVCQFANEEGGPRLRDLYVRDRAGTLKRIAPWERITPPPGRDGADLPSRVATLTESLGGREAG